MDQTILGDIEIHDLRMKPTKGPQERSVVHVTWSLNGDKEKKTLVIPADELSSVNNKGRRTSVDGAIQYMEDILIKRPKDGETFPSFMAGPEGDIRHSYGTTSAGSTQLRDLLKKMVWLLGRFQEVGAQKKGSEPDIPKYSLKAMQKFTSIPVVSVYPVRGSHLLSRPQMQRLRSWLPKRFRTCKPVTLFSTVDDGHLLRTMYQKCRGQAELVLVIRTHREERFGAYIPGTLAAATTQSKRRSCFGMEETFLFSFSPAAGKYPWAGRQGSDDIAPDRDIVISATNNRLIIGGGGRDAIFLDGDMEGGYSGSCNTFKNPPLCKGSHFRCLDVEVVGFQY
ncbi:TBC1 domain family member 24-like [Branchiostoma lanceolatum]|uniref:TBC1 domain family member 24-like n=1 Tax=Branchiostoma lanceolatum TaxID=7740 RepID=UPI00345240F3